MTNQQSTKKEKTMETNPNPTNPSRLLEIAGQLGELYASLRFCETRLANQKEDLENRKIYLAPAEGWPGKNDGERKIAQEKTFAEDETCQALKALIQDVGCKLADMQAEQQALEAERRAIEWTIREQLVMALMFNHVDSNGSGPVEDTAFDDAAEAAMLAAAEEAVFAGGPYPSGAPEGIPTWQQQETAKGEPDGR